MVQVDQPNMIYVGMNAINYVSIVLREGDRGFCTRRSSIAVARDLTSTQRHCARNSFNSLDNFSGCFNFGVPLVAIKYKAFKGSSSAKQLVL